MQEGKGTNKRSEEFVPDEKQIEALEYSRVG